MKVDYTLTATVLHIGMIDYWSGNSRRWDDDAGCVFIRLRPNMTIRDVCEEGVYDTLDSGDFLHDMWEVVTDQDLFDSIRSVFREDLDLDTIFDATTDLEEPDENDEYPVLIVLIELELETEKA